jgi:hypothetical protein
MNSGESIGADSFADIQIHFLKIKENQRGQACTYAFILVSLGYSWVKRERQVKSIR